jgi:uncharacterized alkaline shock family protein YloU
MNMANVGADSSDSGVAEGFSNIGQIRIANDVIAAIAVTAALEAQGIAGMSGGITEGFVDRISGKPPQKGVKIAVTGSSVRVTLSVLVKFGFKIQQTALDVQQKVKLAVETMTGLTVDDVSVVIASVAPDKKRHETEHE